MANASTNMEGEFGEWREAAAEGAAVITATCTFADSELLLSVTALGITVQVACGTPAHVSETAPLNPDSPSTLAV